MYSTQTVLYTYSVPFILISALSPTTFSGGGGDTPGGGGDTTGGGGDTTGGGGDTTGGGGDTTVYIKEFKNRSEANTFDSWKIYFEGNRTCLY
jgi:hypothetical protein